MFSLLNENGIEHTAVQYLMILILLFRLFLFFLLK